MTCIATDGQTMAGDGLICQYDLVLSREAEKVFLLSDGRVVGMAGNCADFLPMRDWLDDDDEFDPPAPVEDGDVVEGLILYPDGRVEQFHGTARPFPIDAPAAIGTARDAAVAAMRLGRTARQAVELAAGMFTTVGGVILDLSPGKP